MILQSVIADEKEYNRATRKGGKMVIEDKEEEKKELPHKILGMIFEEKPEGISVGEIEEILEETRNLAKSLQMVLLDKI